MFLIMLFETSTLVSKLKKFCCGSKNIASLSFNDGNLIKVSVFTSAPFNLYLILFVCLFFFSVKRTEFLANFYVNKSLIKR